MTENVIVVSVCSLALFVPNGAWPVKAPDLDGGTATRSHCRAGNALGAVVFPVHAGLLCPPAGGTPRGSEGQRRPLGRLSTCSPLTRGEERSAHC